MILKAFSFFIDSKSTGLAAYLYSLSTSSIPDTIIAFCIICFGISIIFYIFSSQFAKLSEIAEEIENSEESDYD